MSRWAGQHAFGGTNLFLIDSWLQTRNLHILRLLPTSFIDMQRWCSSSDGIVLYVRLRDIQQPINTVRSAITNDKSRE